MNPENNGRKVYDEADADFFLDELPNYSRNDQGLAYLEDGLIPQSNPLTTPYPEAVAALDQITQQQQLDTCCNLNLVNLLNMPSCSAVISSSNSSISLFESAYFGPHPSAGLLGVDLHNSGVGSSSAAAFEPPLQLHLNLTPQQPPSFFKNEGGSEVFVYSPNRGGGKEPLKQPKNFVTERQRRQTFHDKFQHLRSLLPNPNKNDRASIVGDAIEYIKELTRTVTELKILVEKKRCLKRRLKRYKPTTMEDDNGTTITNAEAAESPDVINSEQVDQSLRSSWLQRRCKDTEIDVRVIDDEVTIKLVQRKKTVNFLLLCVSRAFDELQLDLQHVTGGHVGDYCSFLFNTKIYEGSSVYASAIASKLVDVVDQQYVAFQ